MRFTSLVIVVAFVPGATGGSLEELRAVPLSDFVRTVRAAFDEELRVPAMRFSPDENWIAAVLSDRGSGSAKLVVVSRERQTDTVRFSGRVAPLVTGGTAAVLDWSPNGHTLALGSTPALLVNLDSEKSCELGTGGPEAVLVGGFLSDAEVITAEAVKGEWRLVVYGADCTPRVHRSLARRAVAVRANARTGRILVATVDNRVTLYDAATADAVKSWGRPARTQYEFLENGAAVCEASAPSEQRLEPACWRISDDSSVRSAPAWGGAPFQAAAGDGVVAFTDGKYSFDAFFDTAKRTVRGGVLWDFPSGKVVAKWRPDKQPCNAGDLWRDCTQPSTFDLSTSGSYFTEVKAGQIKIYRLRH